MEKIAILTFFKAGNYGGDLQAYALQKKLISLGYDVEVLHQLRPNNKEFKSTGNFEQIIKLNDNVSKRGEINSKINHYIGKIASILFYKRDNLRKNRFDDFEQKHINLSEKVFYNFDELYKTDLPYDIYIVGSDQVWNYTNPFSPEPYFLTFVKDKKKIAYAASIGHSSLPDELVPLYNKWLNNIDIISTREDQAATLISEISGKSAISVLDPTFLLTKEEWLDNLSIEEKKNEPYLLIYTLSESAYVYNLARFIARIKKIKILRIVPRSWVHKYERNIKNIYNAGPVEFIKLFANASYVITNSFHGTAFSINFNIPFYSVPRKSLKSKSRFISILDKTNLSDRLLYDGSDFPTIDRLLNVDFDETNTILARERERSLDFILEAINKM